MGWNLFLTNFRIPLPKTNLRVYSMYFLNHFKKYLYILSCYQLVKYLCNIMRKYLRMIPEIFPACDTEIILRNYVPSYDDKDYHMMVN